MLRTRDVPPEEMAEVVRVAGELYDREHAADRERQATIAAAGELGIPAEYMERAAAEVHARRVEQIRTRRRRNGIAATLAAAAALGGIFVVRHVPAAPVTIPFSASQPYRVSAEINPETRATAMMENGTGVIRVERFGTGARGTYFANLDIVPAPDLSGRATARFRVRGEGLKQVRLYLENGPTERWRSPAVSVGGDWQTVEIPLRQFDRQTRASSADSWRREAFRAPGQVEKLSFKVGEFMNPASARGEVIVDDLRFE